jgi:hypothetical protein
VLRCQIDASIREVVVEGTSDLLIYMQFFDGEGIADVQVIDGDYIEVDPSAVTAGGFDVGNKGRLLAVGEALQRREDTAHIAANVVVVVDRDFDEDVPPSTGRFVLMTDRHSIENYAYDASALDRLMGFHLGQKPVPVGRDGEKAKRSAPVRGSALITTVQQPCLALAVARCALNAYGVALPSKWLTYVRIDERGRVSVDRGALVGAALKRQSSDVQESVLNALGSCQERLSADPPRFVRGRDFVAVLHKLLRSGWAKKSMGYKLPSMDDDQFRGLLLLAIDWRKLGGFPLFAELRARFAVP